LGTGIAILARLPDLDIRFDFSLMVRSEFLRFREGRLTRAAEHMLRMLGGRDEDRSDV
jgi:hypothetical protein